MTDKNFIDLSTEIMLDIMLKGQAKINVRDFIAVAKETDPFELAHFIEGNDLQLVVVRKEGVTRGQK